MSRISMLLFLSNGWDSSLPWELLLPLFIFIGLHLDIFTWLQLAQCHHQIRVHNFRRTYERTALPCSFPDCWKLLTVRVSVDFTSCCCLPFQFTTLSNCVLIPLPILLCTGIMNPPSDPNRKLDARHEQLLQHCVLCVHPWVFRSEIGASHFRRSFGIAKLHYQECTHHWPLCRTIRLLHRVDQSSMNMCSLQLLCPGSSSPIQTSLECSLHRKQSFWEKRACGVDTGSSQPSCQPTEPRHHSIRHDFSHHQTQNCQWKCICGVSCVLVSLISFFKTR